MFQDNPFSDVELLPAPVVASQNPYAAPCEQWRGQYDWTLAKRMLVSFGLLAGFYLLCSGIMSWQAFSSVPTNQYRSPAEQLESYFLDWQKKPTVQQ